MELWSEMNDVVERVLEDEIELEFEDEIELDNLVDVIDWGGDCKKRRLEEETETNDEIAEEIFKQLVALDSEKTSDETKASNDEIAVEEILRQSVTVDSEKTSGETEASNDEIAVEKILRNILVTVDSEILVTVDSEKTSDEIKASDEKMNDEEMVKEFYRQLDEETLGKEIKRGNEKLKKTRQMGKERDAKWRGEQDKKERAAMKTIAMFVPNLRGIKRRTRLQLLEDVIHHFNTCHSSEKTSDED